MSSSKHSHPGGTDRHWGRRPEQTAKNVDTARGLSNKITIAVGMREVSTFYGRLLADGQQLVAGNRRPGTRTQELALHLWKFRAETQFHLVDEVVAMARTFPQAAGALPTVRVLRQARLDRQFVCEWEEDDRRILVWLEPTLPGAAAATLAWENVADGKSAVAPVSFASVIATFPEPTTEAEADAQLRAAYVAAQLQHVPLPPGRTFGEAAAAYSGHASVAYMLNGLFSSGILEIHSRPVAAGGSA